MSMLWEKSETWRWLVRKTRDSKRFFFAFATVCGVVSGVIGCCVMQLTNTRNEQLEAHLRHSARPEYTVTFVNRYFNFSFVNLSCSTQISSVLRENSWIFGARTEAGFLQKQPLSVGVVRNVLITTAVGCRRHDSCDNGNDECGGSIVVVAVTTTVMMMGQINQERLAEFLGELQRNEDTNDRYIAALRGETLTRKPYVRIQPLQKENNEETSKDAS
ncbi:hypothetical protein MUK42_21896 [Musa troglodytarum]|uniref:Uncharacterized protein n=1 Tax=Musa troglodytarum TaxID=320322 RepID=A0A9E7G8Q0_9LILI|nr:hypothetical protein MUK42_21896 [Musa troglodytarum]